MDDPYLEQVALEVGDWESRDPSMLRRWSGMLTAPLMQLASMLVPETVQQQLSSTLERALGQLHRLGPELVNSSKLHEQIVNWQIRGASEFEARDRTARSAWGWNLALASAEGALTGLAGWAGLLVDGPLLFALALRCQAEIATCYGYDLHEPTEQDYLLHVLGAGLTSDRESRYALTVQIKALETAILHEATSRLSRDLTRQISTRALTQVAAQQGGRVLAERKALQMLPLIGALVGGALSATFLNDLADEAFMIYRRRRLGETLALRSPIAT